MRKMNIIGLLVVSAIVSASVFSADPGPGFSIRNKSEQTIWVEVHNMYPVYAYDEDAVKVKVDNLSSGNNYYEKKIDTTLMYTILYVYSNAEGEEEEDELIVVEIDKGKTIYLNFKIKDGKPLLEPQRGPYWGLKGVTDEGYSTKNNVKQADIKEFDPRDT